jgi:folate-binding protein YgfZ
VSSAIFRLEGPGAVDCVQGVLTNDVKSPGTSSLVWGAVLTPKGMIIADCWVRRDGAVLWLIAPASAHTVLADLLRRSFPPRLVQVADLSQSHAVRWLNGTVPAEIAGTEIVRPTGVAPFTALMITPDAARTDPLLTLAGVPLASSALADVACVLLGWPVLGREIDEKTLPQEVRFDELGGVRYDKGCYTGQETVARLHFRGHANRLLRGMQWEGAAGLADATVILGDKNVGRVSTAARIDGGLLGLAVLRHEVAVGQQVIAGGAVAEVMSLPFALGPGAVA